MKRTRQRGFNLIAALLPLCGLFWCTYRAVRQEQLNRQLITAIKQNKIGQNRAEEIIACLKRGADPNARDEPHEMFLSWNRLLTWFDFRKVASAPTPPALLLALEGDLKQNPVYSDYYWGDADVVKALLQYGADVHVKDKYGRTPLVAAFRPFPQALTIGAVFTLPNSECELALIAAGADVEARDEDGYTALMAGGNVYVERALILRGANINATNHGITALICYVGAGDDEGCRLLLDCGAEIDTANENGGTALITAASEGDSAIVDTLLKHRANINANLNHGSRALIAAAAEGHDAILQTLLQQGAIIDAKDEDGWTALTWAATNGREECVRLLLNKGACVTMKDNQGKTLYTLMKDSDGASNPNIIRLLKRHGMRE